MSPATPLDGRRVLVTGAAGFLGGHVAARLAGRTELHVVLRPDGHVPPDHALGATATAAVHQVDLVDTDDVRRLVDTVRPDVVLHLAGHSSADHRLDSVRIALRDNLTATVEVLAACTEAGVARVVVPGSLDEPEPGRAPLSAYGLARGAVAQAVELFHRVHGLSVASARVFMAYGPRMARHKLVPSIADALLRGEAPVLSAPERALDWVHVDDAVDGILAVAAAAHVGGTAVDIGSGHLATVAQVAEALCGASGTGLRPVSHHVPTGSATGAAAPAGRVADLARTTSLVGWAPRVALGDGLARTWAAIAAEVDHHSAGGRA